MEAFDMAALRETLLDIDEEAWLTFGDMREKLDVVIAGGCAFILRGLTRRPVTHDIDVLEVDARLQQILAGYFMVNGSISAHSDSIPYGYEGRLEDMLPETRCVRFLAPSLEDLIVMKLYASRPHDVSDLTSDAVLGALDWELLERLVYGEDEARASCLRDRRYQEMTAAYEQYKARFREG